MMNAGSVLLKRLRAFVLAVCAVGGGAMAAPVAFADKPPVYTDFLSSVAVGGYDAVAYFKEGKPVKGVKAFSAEYKGAEFRFASGANLEAFLKQPEAYAPQYGGYCAWAAAQGYTARGDPKYWKVVNSKLYLNYDANVQRKWEADVSGHISRADMNWPQVLK